MIDDEVLGLAGGIAGNRDDNAGGLAVDLTGVLLEKAFVAVVAGKIELLVLIQLAGVEYECTNLLQAVQGSLDRRGLAGDILGQIVQPSRVVGRTLATGITACRRCHLVPP